MALKSWNLASCPYKGLKGGAAGGWVLSSSGNAQYYYNDTDLTEKPNAVSFDGALAPEGALGALIAGSWAWGDIDGLGHQTIYVRLSSDSSPNASAENLVQCSEPLVLLTATQGLECILLSLLISNFSYTDNAQIWVLHTTSAGVTRFKWVLDIPATNSPFALDSKLVLNDGDKLKIMAGIEAVAAIASGDES